MSRKLGWETMKLNEKLRQLRETNHWSQEEMAERMSMSPSGYAKIERGETKLNIEKLQTIAQIFNIDIAGQSHYKTPKIQK